MKYGEAIQYMFDALPMFHRQGASAIKKDLTNIRDLCEAMGHPQQQFKSIHIAGTNGKGSVSHMLAAAFQTHGFKTGLYTSPHYCDFRERIKINGVFVPKKYVANFIETNRDLLERIKPSFFEMTVAMAFCYFRDEKVDIAVIETGLGGRLDSTNIIHPELSIITNISWDHSDLLGNTIQKIAKEKAGIIKSKTAVLVGRRQEECFQVFEEKAAEMNAGLYYPDELVPEFSAVFDGYGLSQIIFNLNKQQYNIQAPLNGIYQAENIRTVLAALHLLHQQQVIQLQTQSVQRALEEVSHLTYMIGRWQILSEHPLVVCESAHNEDGLNFLIRQVSQIPYKKLHIVCGFVKDKDLSRILRQLPIEAQYYFVQAKIPRALDSGLLMSSAKEYGLSGKHFKSVRRGFVQASKNLGPDDFLLVTGSIFVVAEILEKIPEMQNSKRKLEVQD
ncbi:MAG: bifunctional folylpolyglutamate synthase/dihydrofolate synthase [Saprospiraceae bacterium]|nr:bifunctional folylpolyglutamate synthase/dihydrofolate synthase [Saprospiraceae bacterium]